MQEQEQDTVTATLRVIKSDANRRRRTPRARIAARDLSRLSPFTF